MKYKKVIGVLLFVFMICAAAIYYSMDAEESKVVVYHSVTDLNPMYRAESEISAAKKKLAAVEPAMVITNDLSGRRQLALTIDGMTDSVSMQRILDLLQKYQAKATFFVEGANAAEYPDTIAAITKAGQNIGNYTFVGLSQAEKLPQDKLLVEFCRTQKVLEVLSGRSPALFKSDRTIYTDTLLKTARASGLDSAVKTNVFVETEKMRTLEEATAFVARLQPGSIVSIKLGRSVEMKVQAKQKLDEKPAVDKKPGVKEAHQADSMPKENVVDVIERLLIAMQLHKYNTDFVENFRKIRYIPAGQSSAAKPKGIAVLLDNMKTLTSALFDMPKAYAAAAPQLDFSRLRAENSGRMAEEIKMVLTTEQAVPISFVGLTKEAVVKDTLEKLRILGAKATFFVMESELQKYPHLVRGIIADGHEIGIAIRPKKEMRFEDTCAEINRTRNLLLTQFGVETDLVKQPWSVISDETKEAVAAMGCRLIGQTINVVQAKHKDFDSAEVIMSEIFGKSVYSVGRGWIVHFRMDYYTDERLLGEVLLLLKQRKIDNIAYRSFDDDPDMNPKNNSHYTIRPVSAMLHNKAFTYVYPVQEENVPMRLRHNVKRIKEEDFLTKVSKRYIGFEWVNEDDRMIGFTKQEMRHMDLDGRVRTDQPVVFFTFDDWGTDAAINKLLYVLRKHNVHGSFFVLTNNVLNNPNLLRAIAMEGHDIGSHSNFHKPLAVRDPVTGKQNGVQNRQEYEADVAASYQRLESVTGDIVLDGQHYPLTRFFRPPTLAVSKMGLEVLFETGYEYIVSGSTSSVDYAATGLHQMIDRIKVGLYEKGAVKKGAVFVMHMSDNSLYTAKALDAILTANAEKSDGDPTKFIVGRLSDYLVDGYDQASRKRSLVLEHSRME